VSQKGFKTIENSDMKHKRSLTESIHNEFISEIPSSRNYRSKEDKNFILKQAQTCYFPTQSLKNMYDRGPCPLSQMLDEEVSHDRYTASGL